jgi:uncharacterized membrane protein YfcA
VKTEVLIISALVGFAAGLASGALGIGGGIILVPLFLLILGLEMKEAVGTSLACLVAYGLVSVTMNVVKDNVRWKILLLVVPLGFLGSYVGVLLANRLPGPVLRRAFGVLLLVAGLKFVFFPNWPGRAPEPPAALEQPAPEEGD